MTAGPDLVDAARQHLALRCAEGVLGEEEAPFLADEYVIED